MIYASFNSKCWKVLLYSMVTTGLKEKDYQFFISSFYKYQIQDFLNEETKTKVNQFVSEFETKKQVIETKKQAIECTKSLVDNEFIKMFNLFGKHSLNVSK